MIERIPTTADGVVGVVTVQLRDADSGRVVFEETGENFISLQVKEVAKWFQRFMWGHTNPVATTNADGSSPSEMPWFPSNHLAYWNDSAAEDAANEMTIMNQIVGWASRYPVGSPSGTRGVVNITESELTDASSKWVFDWVTSQGNGTFQSVGWCNLFSSTSNPYPLAQWPDADRIFVTHSPTGVFNSSLWWNSGDSKWEMTTYDGTSPKVVSRGHTSGASSVEATLSTWGNVGTTSAVRGLAKIGTDYIACGGGTTTGALRRHNSAGATSWTATFSGYHLTDVTYDGTYIWTAGSDGLMRRHDASDGSVGLTITPWSTPSSLAGIAYDSSDSHFWITNGSRTVKVDNAGAFVGPVVGYVASQSSENSTSPFVTSVTPPSTQYRSGYSFNLQTGGATSSIITSTSGNTVTGWGAPTALALKSGELFSGRAISTLGSQITKVPMNTLGSRVKLSSAVTKTSSQSLKITYQFDFV